MNQTTDPVRLSRVLALLSLALWLVSLALPAFMTGVPKDIYRGWAMLIIGLLFGWATRGWAVYANVAFVVVAILLLRGKQPRISVAVMLLLAATLPLFDRVTGIEEDLEVMAWGWGMPVWLSALLMMSAAAIARSGHLRLPAISALACLCVVGLASLLVTRNLQFRSANAQEQDLYLSHGMAFAATDFCGVPFAWPAEPIVKKGELFAADIERSLEPLGMSGDAAMLGLPPFTRRVEEGSEWDNYTLGGWFGGALRVKAVEPARYVLVARRTEQGAVIRIHDRATNSVPYEQLLRVRTSRLKRNGQRIVHNFCPIGNDDPDMRGVKQAVIRALGLPRWRHNDRSPPRLLDENAIEPCPLVRSGEGDRFTWDGREVTLTSEVARKSAAFCSTSYAFLVTLINAADDSPQDYIPYVYVFNRRTLQQLARFDDHRWCRMKDRSRCFDVPNESISGVRLVNGSAVLETSMGRLFAKNGLRLAPDPE